MLITCQIESILGGIKLKSINNVSSSPFPAPVVLSPPWTRPASNPCYFYAQFMTPTKVPALSKQISPASISHLDSHPRPKLTFVKFGGILIAWSFLILNFWPPYGCQFFDFSRRSRSKPNARRFFSIKSLLSVNTVPGPKAWTWENDHVGLVL